MNKVLEKETLGNESSKENDLETRHYFLSEAIKLERKFSKEKVKSLSQSNYASSPRYSVPWNDSVF